MKSYQDPDPLHGNGKAIPKPKRPTQHTYRGGRLGAPRFVNRSVFVAAKDQHRAEIAVSGANAWSMVAILAACIGLRRGR